MGVGLQADWWTSGAAESCKLREGEAGSGAGLEMAGTHQAPEGYSATPHTYDFMLRDPISNQVF